jgi:aarF domain-containing kinase
MASSGSSWMKVASGARLVASAVLKQSAEETGVAAQRILHHGTDLSSKAQKTANVAMPSQEVLWSILRNVIPDPASSTNSGYGAGDSTSSTMTVKSGMSPYESQLRKKRQREEMITASTAEASDSKHEMSNPYLFHQQAASIQNPPTKTNIDPQSVEGDAISNNPLGEEYQQQDAINNISDKTIESRNDTVQSAPTTTDAVWANDEPTTRLREGQAVPSTRVGRAFGFASLGAGLAWGAVGELSSRLVGGSSGSGNAMTNDANADRLAATLCRMRGAALKMGQMLSIQDESLLPPALVRALKQVRQGADAMPNYQLMQQLKSELGDGDGNGSGDENNNNSWRDKFESFDDSPFAAASIGQVHHATIIDKHTGKIKPVVVKVQYPGVAQSIESDLGNLAMLVKMTGLAPKGLFIENVMRVGQDELKVECNYLNEMANQETFQSLVHSDRVLQANKFVVPEVFEDFTTELIITTGYAPGGTIDKVSHLDQEERNRIGRTILYLTMQELFEWRLMQTDPNWGNFLYDVGTGTTTLIDFGATREFPKSFVDGYLRIVWASANQDEETLMAQSRRMGFLTGEENETMLNAHKLSGFTVGEPFWNDEPFDFQGSHISTRMGEHTSVFLRHRLT